MKEFALNMVVGLWELLKIFVPIVGFVLVVIGVVISLLELGEYLIGDSLLFLLFSMLSIALLVVIHTIGKEVRFCKEECRGNNQSNRTSE